MRTLLESLGAGGRMEGWEIPGPCPRSFSQAQQGTFGHVLPLNSLYGSRRMSFQLPWPCLSPFVCFVFEQPSRLCFGERVSSGKGKVQR